jgi:protein-tyrosine phosphatase
MKQTTIPNLGLASPATVRLEGALNFRDLGGLPTEDGRRVKHRQLFRSDSLARLTEGDLAIVRKLEIRLLVDLRTEAERIRNPNRWPPGHEAEFLNLSSSDRGGDFRRILTEDPSPAGARRAMMANYRRKPREFASLLPTLFGRLVAPDRLPAIIHCHAGKDRTGFVVALLLAALGVRREAIRADYVLTAQYWKIDEGLDRYIALITNLTGQVPTTETASVFNVADPAFIDIALDAIEEEYGAIEAYLERVAGVTPAMRDVLRTTLLEDAG